MTTCMHNKNVTTCMHNKNVTTHEFIHQKLMRKHTLMDNSDDICYQCDISSGNFILITPLNAHLNL